MMSLFRKLWKNDRGNALLIGAAALPMIVACAGLASDTIQWTLWKRQLQRAADSAAIAGVYDRENASPNGSTSTVSATVAHDLTLNDHTWMAVMSGYPVINYDSNCPVSSGASSMSNRVCVTLAVQQSLPFSSLFMSTAPTITASATAASIATGTPCALALNSSGTAMNYSGNATVSAPTCILYSDSAASNAASAGGSSAVTAKSIAAVGGIQQSNNWNVQSYIPYSPSIADPFASITPDPTQMNCTNAALTNTSTASSVGSYNCFSSLSVGSNKSLNLDTIMGTGVKTIYINGGSVDLKGDFTCSNCTIVLTNKSTASNATIGSWSSNAQATNNISAPTTGTYSGIAVYQDRRATGNTDKINGGASNVIQGAIYFPKDTLWINGTGTATSLCAMWVANNITFLGNSSIAISSPNDSVCASAGLPTGSSTKMVRLVA